MDEKPFFEFNILDFKDRDVEELKKFAKAAFDVGTILTTASELKYTRAIQNRLGEWMAAPPEEFVKLLSCDLLGKRPFTRAVREQFTPIAKRAFEQLIGERINERLKGAMTPESVTVAPQPAATLPEPAAAESSVDSQITTTLEEIEGFHVVRAILRATVSPKRVTIRDAQSYCAVLLDDNNRKPICRLRFNNKQRLILGVFNEAKEEDRLPIVEIDDIYEHAAILQATVAAYLVAPEQAKGTAPA